MLATTNTLYPVYLYEEGSELPKEGTYYVVAGNGLFIHKDTGVVKCFVPVEKISVLEDLETKSSVSLNLPKIPARHVWRIKQFFKKVFEIHNAEANTILYYNKDDQSFKIHVPEQTVSHSSVNYQRLGLTHREDMANYLRVGTIHSHCDFGAFHSGTDVHDEEDFDGLHCTFGHNDQDEFTISASVVVNGVRQTVNPLDVLDGIEFAGRDDVDFEPSDPQKLIRYCLAPVDPETAAEWSSELDEWLEQVNGCQNPWIFRGNKVVWAGDLTAVPFRKICGDGPFVVEDSDETHITVMTSVGHARFSKKLFRKVI